MSDTIISVENISKRYRIGSHQKADTFAEHLKNGITYPWRNFKRIANMTNFQDEESIFWALQDINFEVKQSEVLGIIGHNGAGKSTLLKILSRITEPTTGQIKMKGRLSALLEVGTGFHPELTGRDNVYMNGTILGMTKREIDSKFDEIIAFSGIETHLDTPVKFYSSGMRVRLAFSVAAHLDPDILVIDEVLAVGDIEFQKKCLGKMEDVSHEGRTVLFVSHNMEAVQHLCKRGILLEKGKMIANTNINEAVNKYLSLNINKQDSKASNDNIYGLKILNLSASSVKQEAAPVILGKPLLFCIDLHTELHIPDLVIRIQIFSPERLLLFTCQSYHKEAVYSLTNGDHQIYCSISSCPLPPGLYKIDIQMLTVSKREILIEEENFSEFIVETSDFYGRGKLPKKKQIGVMVLGHEWSN